MSDPSERVKADHDGINRQMRPGAWTRERYVQALRVMMSDIKEMNVLLKSQETSDEKLALMLDLTLGDFNGDTPPTSFAFEEFPNPNCLIQGAMAMTLDSLCAMHARNALQYSDDGISIEDFGKDGRYGQLSMKHKQSYDQLKDYLKRMINAQACFGQFGSEYGWINRIIR